MIRVKFDNGITFDSVFKFLRKAVNNMSAKEKKEFLFDMCSGHLKNHVDET